MLPFETATGSTGGLGSDIGFFCGKLLKFVNSLLGSKVRNNETSFMLKGLAGQSSI